ncbi:MAG: germination protein YpeB [Clostridiales bacterium]|nr:germination protein YpeB [Clostridiales bacterium]
MVYIKKKTLVILTAFALAAIAVTAGFVLQAKNETHKRDLLLKAARERAFTGFADSVGDLDMSLQKTLCAGSSSLMASLCTDVYGKALAAEMTMSELPLAEFDLSGISSFISKVGDYALSLARTAASGKNWSPEERLALDSLTSVAAGLNLSLNDLRSGFSDGSVQLESVSAVSDKAGEAAKSLGESFKSIESEFPEVPSLIYDGPFSAHILRRSPVSLEGLDEINAEQAAEAAADFCKLEPYVFDSVSECGGSIPAWCCCASADGGELTVYVTRTGGKILSMINSRAVYSVSLSEEDSVKAAVDFLSERGLTEVKESYYEKNNGILLVNFAAVQDGVILYPDLVKVSVAMDNGRVVGYEANGMIMNHCPRDIPEPSVSAGQAAQTLPGDISVISDKLAIIPTAGMNEAYCRELLCEDKNGTRYLIYVNAENGTQEKILVLIESENGTLTK